MVRYERLILTSGDHAVALRFHPRLTVIAGVGPLEREGIIGELLGSLRGPRPGTNLEVVSDDGRRVAVLRPGWGLGDRALDADTGEELTDELCTPDGRLDLLAPHGLTTAQARRLSRFRALDLMPREAQDGLVAVMAGRPQRQLWAAAERLAAARQRLSDVAGDAGAGQETAVIAEVDACHVRYEAAQERCESIRHHGIFTGMACAVAGLPAVIMNRWSALGFVAVAAAFVVVSVVFRRRLERTRCDEERALADAGASSYGGFLHQRVAAMISVQETQRRQISAAVAEHRAAEAAWASTVGDVDLDWAFDHQSAIAAAAGSAGDADGEKLAQQLLAARPPAPDELAGLLLARVTSLDAVGPLGESLPLLLDEPFAGLEVGTKRWLLELVNRCAGHPQVILLTKDEDIADWATREEDAGALSVLSPSPRPAQPAWSVAC